MPREREQDGAGGHAGGVVCKQVYVITYTLAAPAEGVSGQAQELVVRAAGERGCLCSVGQYSSSRASERARQDGATRRSAAGSCRQTAHERDGVSCCQGGRDESASEDQENY